MRSRAAPYMIIGTINPYATKNGIPSTIVGIQVAEWDVDNSHRSRKVTASPIARINGETMKISNVANPLLLFRISGNGTFPTNTGIREPEQLTPRESERLNEGFVACHGYPTIIRSNRSRSQFGSSSTRHRVGCFQKPECVFAAAVFANSALDFAPSIPNESNKQDLSE